MLAGGDGVPAAKDGIDGGSSGVVPLENGVNDSMTTGHRLTGVSGPAREDTTIDLRDSAGGSVERRRPLQGLTVLVTGADRPVGRSIAVAAARAGARLVVMGDRLGELRRTASAAAPDGTAVALHATLGSVRDTLSAARFYEQMDKPLDLLVHASTDAYRHTVADGPLEQLDHHYLVNLRAPYALTQALLPVLKRSGGQVIFVTSDGALYAEVGDAHSGPTLFGQRALADSLRDECIQHGVRVLNLFAAEVSDDDGPVDPLATRWRLRPSDIARTVVAACSLGPTVEVTELRVRPLQQVG